jgi:hypothetical protein
MPQFEDFFRKLAGSDEYRAFCLSIEENTQGSLRDAGLYIEDILERINQFAEGHPQIPDSEMQQYIKKYLPELCDTPV